MSVIKKQDHIDLDGSGAFEFKQLTDKKNEIILNPRVTVDVSPVKEKPRLRKALNENYLDQID